ncbi:ATP/GTP-binding protein [Streptomyces sp. NPDC007872]|uniref:GTP-binding protein n=1 Tax=Streptomyces sp. NPDC007872 TaxID=3364782 RepID=UPI003699F269
MDCARRSEPPPATLARRSAKIVIAGGFAVGKTTFVEAVSEIPPVRTEELITQASAGIDSLARVPAKTTTTVGIDFGRIHINDELVLYLFGLAGQDRFQQTVSRETAYGALGALVLVDTRDLDASHSALTLLEEEGVPYAVAVNRFAGAPRYPSAEIRQALGLETGALLNTCDAREHRSGLLTLIDLLSYLTSRHHALERRL